MKFLLTIFVLLICYCQSFALTTDQLAQFLNIHSWESEVQLPRNSFTVEVLEFSDGKVGKAVFPAYDDSTDAAKASSATIATPIVVMWKPEGKSIELTVTMGSPETGTQTRPGLSDACDNFHGPTVFMRGPQSIKEGDYILGGEPLEHDGTYRGTDNIKDYKRGLLLRIIKKA